MTIDEIYSKAHKIPKSLEFYNKYTWLGFNKLVDVRILDINDTFTNDFKFNDFIKRYKRVLLFPNFINSVMVDLMIKPIDTNDRILSFRNFDIPYGTKYFSKEFKYGDPVILVEGIGDLGALRLLSKDLNIIALKTNSVTDNIYDFISTITNNVIIIPDNELDRKAIRLAYHSKKKFAKLGVTLKIVKQFSNFKDTGTLLDVIVNSLKVSKEYFLSKSDLIESAKKYYLTQISINS